MEASKHVISTNYSAEEIFAILKEQHRLCSPLDIIADETFILIPQTTIWEWRDAQDLLEWKELTRFLNQEFRVNISHNEWRTCFEPDEKPIIAVCQLIAKYAVKQRNIPKKLFGKHCLMASAFLDLRNRLKAKGVDVSKLRPSSEVAPYLEKYFSPVLEEVTLTGVQVFDEIEYDRSQIVYCKLNAGRVVTFRDIVNRICEGKQLTS